MRWAEQMAEHSFVLDLFVTFCIKAKSKLVLFQEKESNKTVLENDNPRNGIDLFVSFCIKAKSKKLKKTNPRIPPNPTIHPPSKFKI